MIEVSDPFFEEFGVSPSEKAAFNFFYSQTAKEGLPITPEFAWAQFQDGVAPFNGKTLEEFNETATLLVPNYNAESSAINNVYPFTPINQSISEGFIRNLERARVEKSARVIGIHPTLASPLVYARAIGMGYERYLDTDIRPKIYITYGAYPTTMRYDYGDKFRISPIELGRTLGNVILTAPKSDNTLTDNEMVDEWMTATRATFKMRNHDVLTEPGNIVIVIPSGRRGERSKAKINPKYHKEFLPDGSIRYITDYDNDTFVMGVGDTLLVNKDNPTSLVHVGADSMPFQITSRKSLRDALVRSAMLASTRLDIYAVEGSNDQRIRLGLKAAGKLLSRTRPEGGDSSAD
jgi:hypothetical protein